MSDDTSPKLPGRFRIVRIGFGILLLPVILYYGVSRIVTALTAILAEEETIRMSEGEWFWLVVAALVFYIFLTGVLGWDTRHDRAKRRIENRIMIAMAVAMFASVLIPSHITFRHLECSGYELCDVSGGRLRMFLWSRIGCEGLEKFEMRPPERRYSR